MPEYRNSIDIGTPWGRKYQWYVENHDALKSLFAAQVFSEAELMEADLHNIIDSCTIPTTVDRRLMHNDDRRACVGRFIHHLKGRCLAPSALLMMLSRSITLISRGPVNMVFKCDASMGSRLDNDRTFDNLVYKYRNDINSSYLVHECFVGQKLNMLSPYIPNFIYTYTYINNVGSPTISTTGSVLFIQTRSVGEYLLITEKVDSDINLISFITDRIRGELDSDDGTSDPVDVADIIKVLAQVFAALADAQRLLKFVHGDLHSNNILVVDTGDDDNEVVYRLNNRTVRIKSRYVPVIIDLELSRIEVDSVVYTNKTSTCEYTGAHIDFQEGAFIPWFDPYRLVSDIINHLLIAKLFDATSTICCVIAQIHSINIRASPSAVYTMHEHHTIPIMLPSVVNEIGQYVKQLFDRGNVFFETNMINYDLKSPEYLSYHLLTNSMYQSYLKESVVMGRVTMYDDRVPHSRGDDRVPHSRGGIPTPITTISDTTSIIKSSIDDMVSLTAASTIAPPVVTTPTTESHIVDGIYIDAIIKCAEHNLDEAFDVVKLPLDTEFIDVVYDQCQHINLTQATADGFKRWIDGTTNLYVVATEHTDILARIVRPSVQLAYTDSTPRLIDGYKKKVNAVISGINQVLLRLNEYMLRSIIHFNTTQGEHVLESISELNRRYSYTVKYMHHDEQIERCMISIRSCLEMYCNLDMYTPQTRVIRKERGGMKSHSTTRGSVNYRVAMLVANYCSYSYIERLKMDVVNKHLMPLSTGTNKYSWAYTVSSTGTYSDTNASRAQTAPSTNAHTRSINTVSITKAFNGYPVRSNVSTLFSLALSFKSVDLFQ